MPDSNLAASCALAADLGACAPTGDPQGQVRPPDGPAASLEAPPRVPIFAEWGSSDIRPKRTPRPEPRAGGPLNSTQDHRSTGETRVGYVCASIGQRRY